MQKFKISRNTVKKYLETSQPITYNPRLKRRTNTETFQTPIVEGFETKKSITAIFQQLQQQGFTGSYTAVRNTVSFSLRIPSRRSKALFSLMGYLGGGTIHSVLLKENLSKCVQILDVDPIK